ncbi:hypothetical protein AB0M20_14735 [Actinoplanes sp. NPDC051633]|uniref:hypothetical protein n=1 Tax=Actinoplanes sp. NPDC051633 TaxID=3155670 RepID=UPI0034403C0A
MLVDQRIGQHAGAAAQRGDGDVGLGGGCRDSGEDALAGLPVLPREAVPGQAVEQLREAELVGLG